jgi:hypothetical protein
MTTYVLPQSGSVGECTATGTAAVITALAGDVLECADVNTSPWARQKSYYSLEI